MLARRLNGVPLIPLLCFAAVGLVAVVVGVRGRRIDDHPICRKCRFDLVGLYPAIHICPECGSRLDRRRAVLNGLHRRRWRLFTLGSLLVLFALSLTTGLTYRQYSTFGAPGLKPLWMLRWEARRGAGWGTGYQAMTELGRRFAVGELDDATVDSLVNEALEERLKDAGPWNPGWGDFFAQAVGAGRVAPEQHARYMRQLAGPVMWIQPRIRSGDVPEHRVEWVSPGGDKNYRAGLRVDIGAFRCELLRIEVDGAPIVLAPSPATVYYKDYWCPPGRSWSYAVRGPEPPGFPPITAAPGRHTVTVTWNVIASRIHGDDDPLAQWQAQSSQEIEVFPPGAAMVEMVVDAAQREAMRNAFEVQLFISSDGGAPRLEGRINTRDAPMMCAFRLDLRFGESWLDSGFGEPATVYSGPTGSGSAMFSAAMRDPTAAGPGRGDIVRAILMPDAGTAEKRGVLKMWGEPIEYEVEVR